MKKVALPSSGNMVDGHFGHCEHFTVYTIDSNNNIAQKEVVPSPNGCGCKSNIASVLAEKGVDTMLAGNIGQGAVNTLQKSGITVHGIGFRNKPSKNGISKKHKGQRCKNTNGHRNTKRSIVTLSNPLELFRPIVLSNKARQRSGKSTGSHPRYCFNLCTNTLNCNSQRTPARNNARNIHGFLKKVFEVFDTFKTSVDMITTSEVAVSLTIDNDIQLPAIVAELKQFSTVEVDIKQAIICIVGDFVAEKPGTALKIMEVLHDIPIRMISYGGSSHNISMKLIESCKRANINTIEVHLVLETNTRMLAELERAGAKFHKRFRVFQKML